MPEEPSELVEQIQHDRTSLNQHLAELEMKTQEVTDWRRFIRRNPELLLTGALTAGALIALMLFGRRHKRVTYEY